MTNTTNIQTSAKLQSSLRRGCEILNNLALVQRLQSANDSGLMGDKPVETKSSRDSYKVDLNAYINDMKSFVNEIDDETMKSVAIAMLQNTVDVYRVFEPDHDEINPHIVTCTVYEAINHTEKLLERVA